MHACGLSLPLCMVFPGADISPRAFGGGYEVPQGRTGSPRVPSSDNSSCDPKTQPIENACVRGSVKMALNHYFA